MFCMRILFCLAFIGLIGCGGSPLATGQLAEKNKIYLMKLKADMTKAEVRRVMGNPYKIEIKTIDNSKYEIWYYVTAGTFLGQYEYLDKNFTPIIFKNEKVLGWGRYYYDYIMDINNARQKTLEEMRQKYTDDPDEWPADDHRMIPLENLLQQFEEKEIKQDDEIHIPQAQDTDNNIENIPQTNENDINTIPQKTNDADNNDDSKKIDYPDLEKINPTSGF
jgi:outer membrane protein assembly factor BamE (lipoprotein component of BamABCDE complex)